MVRALLSPTRAPDDEERIAAFIEIAFLQPFLAGFKSMWRPTGDPDGARAPAAGCPSTKGSDARCCAALDRCRLPGGRATPAQKQ